MNTLLVCSTPIEIKPILDLKEIVPKNGVIQTLSKSVSVLISEVGIVHATYNLTKNLDQIKKNKFCVLNVGVCGSFHKNFNIGSLVSVKSDQFSDLGAEDNKKHLSIFEMGLLNENEHPFQQGKLILDDIIPTALPKVNGITVNCATGSSSTLQRLKTTLDPDIETMEGAAVAFVCKKEAIPISQIRAISNYVEKRNTKNWNIPLAVENLNKYLLKSLAI